MKKPKTTGELIRAARLAKSRRLHAQLDPKLARRIKPDVFYRQSDLADDIDSDASQVSMWERDETRPELFTLKKLAKALEVPLLDLVGEEK